jgi:hypothetical protein
MRRSHGGERPAALCNRERASPSPNVIEKRKTLGLELGDVDEPMVHYSVVARLWSDDQFDPAVTAADFTRRVPPALFAARLDDQAKATSNYSSRFSPHPE